MTQTPNFYGGYQSQDTVWTTRSEAGQYPESNAYSYSNYSYPSVISAATYAITDSMGQINLNSPRPSNTMPDQIQPVPDMQTEYSTTAAGCMQQGQYQTSDASDLNSRQPCRHVYPETKGLSITDKDYQVRNKDYKKFFQVGHIFLTLWTDADRKNPPGRIDATFVSHVNLHEKYGSNPFVQIRRFIVLQQKDFSCICLPITSYDGTGHRRQGIRLEEHGFIYSEHNTSLKPIPGMLSKPLRANLSKGATLPERCLVNYGKLYTVEMNVKVKAVGRLYSDSISILLSYAKKALDLKAAVGMDYTGQAYSNNSMTAGDSVSTYAKPNHNDFSSHPYSTSESYHVVGQDDLNGYYNSSTTYTIDPTSVPAYTPLTSRYLPYEFSNISTPEYTYGTAPNGYDQKVYVHGKDGSITSANLLLDSGNQGYNLISDAALQVLKEEPRGPSATVSTLDGSEIETSGEVEVTFSGASDGEPHYYTEKFRSVPHITGGHDMVMNREFLNKVAPAPPTLLLRAGRAKKLTAGKF